MRDELSRTSEDAKEAVPSQTKGASDRPSGTDGVLGRFFAELLALQCRCCRAKHGAVLQLDGDSSFRTVALHPPDQAELDQPQWLQRSAATANQVFSSGGAAAVPVDGDSLRTECDPKGLGLLVYKKERFGNCQIRVVFKSERPKSNSGIIVRMDDGILEQAGHPWDWNKVNVNGGAVALGHPIGCSGARVLTTLIYALHDRGLQRGLAALCLGGGEAVAMAVEIEANK